MALHPSAFTGPPRPVLALPTGLVSIPSPGATRGQSGSGSPLSPKGLAHIHTQTMTNCRALNGRHKAKERGQDPAPKPGLTCTISFYLHNKSMREILLFQFSDKGDLDELLRVLQLRGSLDRIPGQVCLLQTPCF